MRTSFSFNSPAWLGIPALRAFVLLAALAIALGAGQMARAQDTITIKDPQEYAAYQQANGQTDPKTKAAQFEAFLQAHPQSVVKAAVLDTLIDTYQGLNDADLTLSAASRLLQADPNNMKAIFVSVFIKKNICAKTRDPQTCDDAAALAQKGLTVPKPDATTDDDWKRMTDGTYPVFHSALALDDILSKKDLKAGISEYRKELMLYPADQTKKGPGLWDTLQLAEAYVKQVKDVGNVDGIALAQAVWFYARAWNFAPVSLKNSIETKMKFYYAQHHGNLEGLDEIKALAEANLFPPDSFVISPTIQSRGMPVQPRKRSVVVQEKSLAIAIPEVAALMAMPPMPGTPIWPANQRPRNASITWDSHGLFIDASNSSLQQILKDVATVTGATVEGMDADQRIFGTYGPGSAHDVLAELLQGTSYNVLMIGDQGEGTPREIVLSARNAAGKTTVAANSTQSSEEDADTDDQPQAPQPPVRPPFGPGGPRGPQPMRMPPGQPQPGQGQPPNNPQ